MNPFRQFQEAYQSMNEWAASFDKKVDTEVISSDTINKLTKIGWKQSTKSLKVIKFTREVKKRNLILVISKVSSHGNPLSLLVSIFDSENGWDVFDWCSDSVVVGTVKNLTSEILGFTVDENYADEHAKMIPTKGFVDLGYENGWGKKVPDMVVKCNNLGHTKQLKGWEEGINVSVVACPICKYVYRIDHGD